MQSNSTSLWKFIDNLINYGSAGLNINIQNNCMYTLIPYVDTHVECTDFILVLGIDRICMYLNRHALFRE